MTEITCPTCGEQERLQGNRQPDGTIQITCEPCGASWDRDTRPRCRLCGSEELIYAPKSLMTHGRGTQTTQAGQIDQYACAACGGRNVTSANARPGQPSHQLPPG